MWQTKENSNIIWIDIEPELEVPPDKIMDCTQTEFPDNQFTTIFFDPPHGWGKQIGRSATALRNKSDRETYPWKAPHGLMYWGWDKYHTKTQLLSFIHKAQKEFSRILKNDGMLWVKWNECNIPLRKILPLFRDWNEMLRFPIASQAVGDSQTYWIMFMKKLNSVNHLDLATFCENPPRRAKVECNPIRKRVLRNRRIRPCPRQTWIQKSLVM